tara:strand:- start:381 stop:578 length:198 start_codon:yes stop_codon:yes gene_type:complete
MWDGNHFKREGWLSHTKRAFRLSLLLILAAAAMVLHTLVPFWQQPKTLQLGNVADAIQKEMSLRE